MVLVNRTDGLAESSEGGFRQHCRKYSKLWWLLYWSNRVCGVTAIIMIILSVYCRARVVWSLAQRLQGRVRVVVARVSARTTRNIPLLFVNTVWVWRQPIQ